jgi:hypothetical protein
MTSDLSGREAGLISVQISRGVRLRAWPEFRAIYQMPTRKEENGSLKENMKERQWGLIQAEIFLDEIPQG